jgi:hypothetical protein
MVESFWKIPKDTPIRTPATILGEQAAALTQATGGDLEGKVTREGSGSQFVCYLDIIVPALNRYKFRLLVAYYPVSLYPVTLIFAPENDSHGANNEAEFIALLKQILASEGVAKILTGLRAQAQTI